MNNAAYEIQSRSRQLRYVYFIEEAYPADKLLKLINENQKLWGGRLNPIIPIDKNGISDAWRQLAGEYDPDYVGFTGNLTGENILNLCLQLGYNPIEVINIDENSTRIEGVESQNLLPAIENIFDNIRTVPQCTGLWKTTSPLKDYFKLNYLLDDSYRFMRAQLGPHQAVVFDGNKLNEFNKTFAETRIFNTIELSTINSNTTKMRTLDGPHFEWFELIIAKDYSSTHDVLYHWNRALYAPRNYPISSFLITEEQLDILLQDPNFEGALYNLPTNNAQMQVASFSLKPEELVEWAKKLATLAKRLRFIPKPNPVFPYAKSDNKGYYLPDFKEQPITRTVTGNNILIDVPTLSFNPAFRSNTNTWTVDIDIKDASVQKGNILFPRLSRPGHYIDKSARIRKNRSLSCQINSGNNRHYSINIPTFFQIVSQVIIHPNIINENPQLPQRSKYHECKFNDGSNRLKEFIKLFNEDLNFISEYIFDQFWADIFYDLTDNTKVEGDTITFEQIIERYYKLIATHNFITARYAASRYNDENLRFGIQDTLQPLIKRRVFLPGFIIKCKSCSSSIWYSMKETDVQMTCKGCGAENYFLAELPISYKLNHLIKNNIGLRSSEGKFSPDGNYTAIKTIIHLYNKSSYNFQYLPQLDIFDSYHSPKPVTDLDISCMVDGALYVGECKHNSLLFSNDGHKSLNNLLEIAKFIHPDYILIACTVDDNNKLTKAQQYLEHHIKKWDVQPKVYAYITRRPEYDLKSYCYFRY